MEIDGCDRDVSSREPIEHIIREVKTGRGRRRRPRTGGEHGLVALGVVEFTGEVGRQRDRAGCCYRLLGIHSGREETVTEDEVRALITEGTRAGVRAFLDRKRKD